jgi:hypothetical protein
VVNAAQGLHPPSEDALRLTRDFDSGIGISRNLPFTCALSIYPVPSFRDTLKKSNYLRGPVTLKVSTLCTPLAL